MKRIFKRLGRLLFCRKKTEMSKSNFPIWKQENELKYNFPALYCSGHKWFYFTTSMDFGSTPLENSQQLYENRICECCFLWQTRWLCQGDDFSFIGSGKHAFNKLTDIKIKKIIDQDVADTISLNH